MFKSSIVLSLLSLSLFLSGCAVEQSSLTPGEIPASVDPKSRVAIAKLIETVGSMEESSALSREQINSLASSVDYLAKSVIVMNQRLEELESKKEQGQTKKSKKEIATKDGFSAFVVLEGVRARSCPEMSCKIRKVYEKNESFYGKEATSAWIETDEGAFVYSKYVKIKGEKK